MSSAVTKLYKLIAWQADERWSQQKNGPTIRGVGGGASDGDGRAGGGLRGGDGEKGGEQGLVPPHSCQPFCAPTKPTTHLAEVRPQENTKRMKQIEESKVESTE
jgi:hypothetical protein